MSTARPVILALHGFGRTGDKHMKLDFFKGHELLNRSFDIYYAEGQIDVPAEVLRDMAGDVDHKLPDYLFTGNFSWFRARDGVYEGLQESVDYLKSVCEAKQPVGIVGWSQGGLMALLLSALMQAGEPSLQSLKFIVAMGTPCTRSAKRHINAILMETPHSKVTLPTLFWGSKRDHHCRYMESFSAELFDNATVQYHEETTTQRNHALPRKEDSWRHVVEFCSNFQQ